MPIEVIQADITTLAVDAIVNAANARMLGGGGVDGAIHRAAGPRLLNACRAVPEVRPGVRCPTGEARLTPGFDLPAKYVIHTVGPVWHGGGHGEAEFLSACYTNSLKLAAAHGVTSIAFPAISTGVYGYPVDQAAAIATKAVAHTPIRVLLVCFGVEAHAVYMAAVRREEQRSPRRHGDTEKKRE